jgi:hypothetical protein
MNRTTAVRVVLMTALLASGLVIAFPAWAQLPDAVRDLRWCPGAKDCLSWTAVDGATGYNVYLGRGEDLPGLLDAAMDSCTLGSFVVTTTGSILRDPPPHVLDWYLVTATNASGEGGAGEGTFGPRLLDSPGPCGIAAGFVLNEVDYDQPGTDYGEFVEIYNAHADDRDLSGLALIFVNGLSSSEYRRVELSEAGSTLPAGGYLVAGTADVVATLPPGTLSVTLPSSSNNIQNGAPDGLALFDMATLTLLDALSYEGSITAATFDGIPGTFNLVEGSAATAQDSNSAPGSLVRFPDGTDSDQADSDWHFVESPSPGASNQAP